MLINSLKNAKNLKGQRVLLRLDLNVPLKRGQASKDGDERLRRSLPTIKYLIKKRAKIIIVAHLGRPQGKIIKSLSLQPVAKHLSKLLKKPIAFWPGKLNKYYEDSLSLKPGSVAMLENIRFEPREQMNCRRLARRLAKLADIYVNDAFGNIHRQDSSMLAVTYYLPSYAGLLIIDEINYLSRALKAKQGLAMIFGGAKIATKLPLIKKFSQRGWVFLGGALASTMLLARGYQIGGSLVDKGVLREAKKVNSKNIYLPIDVVVANSYDAKNSKIVSIDKVPKQGLILDLGPKTIKNYLKILKRASIIVWNGPLGYFENSKFMVGSKSLLRGLAKLKAKTIIGGGETVALLNQLKLANKFSFVSTGGGAMLSFLQGDKLPSLQALRIK